MHPVALGRRLVRWSDDLFGIHIFDDRHQPTRHKVPRHAVIRNELALTIAKVADCARFVPEFAFSRALHSKRAAMALSSPLGGTCLEQYCCRDFGGKRVRPGRRRIASVRIPHTLTLNADLKVWMTELWM